MSEMTVPRNWPDEAPRPPHIGDDEPFADVVRKLSLYANVMGTTLSTIVSRPYQGATYFVEAIDAPYNFEQLRTVATGRRLNPLVKYITDDVHHRAIVCALLALKFHFSSLESDDNRGINESRGFACEIVAWRIVTHLSKRDAIDYLLYELEPEATHPDHEDDAEAAVYNSRPPTNEGTPLLHKLKSSSRPATPQRWSYFGTDPVYDDGSAVKDDNFTEQFLNLNALEIAAVCGAKRFLSQKPVQKIINGIWRGDIVFWETLSVNSVKKAKVYNKRRTFDPYCRLRVPRYLKTFEVLFFATFLALYYVVLVQKSFYQVTPAEILLYIWLAGFAYDEFGEIQDAGQTSFYTTDFWFLWDLGIVALGLSFAVLRIVGLKMHSDRVIDTSFDILALEALLLIPRICSVLSLNPYFGTLIPCLKEMTKDFVKFLSLVIILYMGFLTTFTLLARGIFTLREMSWILVKVFFGSSYLGFDVAHEISPIFGPPIMLVFIVMTNILLITSLISLLSNSLTKIMDHAREEYLFIYSVYVLEASTSNRLTYFLPPLNLIPLLFRPLRLIISSEKLRRTRIVLLKVTHAPHVAAIWAYESGHSYFERSSTGRGSWLSSTGGPEASSSLRRTALRVPLASPRAPAPARGVPASSNGSPSQRSPTLRLNRQHVTAEPSEAEGELKALVLRLSSQVEQLTAVVAQLQGQQVPPSADGD